MPDSTVSAPLKANAQRRGRRQTRAHNPQKSAKSSPRRSESGLLDAAAVVRFRQGPHEHHSVRARISSPGTGPSSGAGTRKTRMAGSGGGGNAGAGGIGDRKESRTREVTCHRRRKPGCRCRRPAKTSQKLVHHLKGSLDHRRLPRQPRERAAPSEYQLLQMERHKPNSISRYRREKSMLRAQTKSFHTRVRFRKWVPSFRQVLQGAL